MMSYDLHRLIEKTMKEFGFVMHLLVDEKEVYMDESFQDYS